MSMSVSISTRSANATRPHAVVRTLGIPWRQRDLESARAVARPHGPPPMMATSTGRAARPCRAATDTANIPAGQCQHGAQPRASGSQVPGRPLQTMCGFLHTAKHHLLFKNLLFDFVAKAWWCLGPRLNPTKAPHQGHWQVQGLGQGLVSCSVG